MSVFNETFQWSFPLTNQGLSKFP